MRDQKGKLYLGRRYDLDDGQTSEAPVLYEMRHLTTHGVILGMTGSGKTGLGMVLLEEALLQGVPALIIDPKGDMTNLALTFPTLSAAAFQPWVEPEAARRRGLDLAAYAQAEAETWRQGLDQWGVDGQRIARLRQSAEVTVYSPGSEAGEPVDVLQFFDLPDEDWDEHEEALRERIAGIVSALLGLVGVEADPLQSAEHIFLARAIEHVWRAGEHLGLAALIRMLQEPPFRQVGVFDVDTFFPEKDRFTLARLLNNLLASPGFELWQRGTPLQIADLLYTPEGRPRASVFYLAHLDDAQRMFFITLLLEAVRDWLRHQSGTTDLRALLYCDEVFGFFPPYPINPPSKMPLMALIKQGRAAGLGVVLATQNPADLDYKGLTNAGTWVIGSLRAERDKERVLEGLEGAVAEAGGAFDRRALDRSLGTLKPRVFLLHDIHEGSLHFFHTRWAMSYLRGPLTRSQVSQLRQAALPVASPAELDVQQSVARATEAAGLSNMSATPPAVPPEVPQVHLSPTVAVEWAIRSYEERVGDSLLVREKRLLYRPRLLAFGLVRTLDRKRDVDHQQSVSRLVTLTERTTIVRWEGEDAGVTDVDLSPQPVGQGVYAPAPSTLTDAREIKRLEKDFSDYLYHNVSTPIWFNPVLELYGQVGESKREFRLRSAEAARQGRDEELAKARAKVDKAISSVQAKLRREQRELAGDQEELDARKREELLTIGESALNLLTGRRSSAMISRASRKRRMTRQAKSDVAESLEAIEDLEQQIEALSEDWQAEAARITDHWAAQLDVIETHTVTPRRADVMIQFCGLAWSPVWQVLLDDGRVLELDARQRDAQGANRSIPQQSARR